MTRPLTSPKLVLIEDPRVGSDPERGVRVRRFRLARVQLGVRSSDPASRFDHLKRVYD